MKTLYRQFIVMTLVILCFGTLVGFLITNTYYHLVVKEQNDEKNVTIAEEITHYIESSEAVDLEKYLSNIASVGYQFYVINEDGDSQFIGGEFKEKELPKSVEMSVLNGEIFHGMETFPNHSFMTAFFANELTNTVGVPFTYEGVQYGLFLRPNILLLFSEVHAIIMGFFVSITLISLISVIFVAKQLVKPITQLTEATKKVSREQFDLLLNINRKDEIGQLAKSFNEMTTRLKENDQYRKEFISNVSHDFQSPLLNIQGYADLLKLKDITEDERINYTMIIETETKKLSNLTKQLLLLTSLDKSTRELNYTAFSIDEQMKELTHKYMWLIEELGIELYFKMSPTQIYGDEALLETVWDNLFTNALKYNKQNGMIQIEITQTENEVTVLFKDSGIGLKENELPLIFDRFYRADASRTKEGTGLGLSIVKEIIDLHKGTIHVESKENVGTLFVISIPKKLINVKS